MQQQLLFSFQSNTQTPFTGNIYRTQSFGTAQLIVDAKRKFKKNTGSGMEFKLDVISEKYKDDHLIIKPF